MIDITTLEINLKKVSITYSDFRFDNGDVIFVKGKNGTGKSILLKALAGLITTYTGEIVTDDFVTYVAQEPYMFDKTVRENIHYPLKIRDLDVSIYEEKLMEYAKALEIDKLLNKEAKNLSSGEKMKVSILRALIFKPGTILLDEPTSYLDVESIHQLKNIIIKLKKEINFIIVSHNEAFFNSLEDQSIILGEANVYRKDN